MTIITDLDINPIKAIDNSNMYVVILFTLSDEQMEGQSDKRKARMWNTFSKKYGKDIARKNYYASTEKEMLKENDDFSKKEVVVFTNLESLAVIDERDKDRIEFGFRILKDGNIIPLDHSITNDLEKDNLNKNLVFDEVEDQYTKLNQYLEKRVEEKKMQEEEIEKKAEIVEEETAPQINDTQDDKTELPADLSKELEEQEKYADSNKIETQQTDANTENEVRYSVQEQTMVSENKDEIAGYRNKLYAYLEAQIPNPDLNSIDLNNILSKVDYKGYKDLYILALDGIEKRINQKNYLIQEERKKLINDIYRRMETELNKRYRENTNLVNYKSSDNEYGHIYKDIKDNYDAAINSLEEHRKEKELFLTEQFNINKKQYVEREAKRAEEEYDKINKPIIKQEITEFIEGIRAQADTEKQLQLEKLEDDIYLDVSGRNDELIDNLIKDYMPSIDGLVTTISNDFQDHVTEILNKTESAVVKLIDQVQDVEKKRVEAASLSAEKVDAEVARKTVDYSQLKKQVSELEQLIFDKKKEAGNYQEELLKKDAQLQSAAEERKSLADDREYHKLRADNASRELNELRELQIKAMQETANNPYVTVRATTIEKKRNNGEKLTLSEKLEGIDRKIYNMIGAALIAASLLGSAAILGGNDDNQNEIKSLEQQVKAQQEQINEAKSAEEATTEAPTTEEPKTEAPKSKKSEETKSR